MDLIDTAFAPLAALIAAERIPGGVLGIIDADGTRAVKVAGRAQIVPEVREMTRDTWFDLASLTKVIYTTTRIL